MHIVLDVYEYLHNVCCKVFDQIIKYYNAMSHGNLAKMSKNEMIQPFLIWALTKGLGCICILFCYHYRTPFYFWKTATEGLYGVKGIFGHFHPRKNVVYVRSCLSPVTRCSDNLELFLQKEPNPKISKMYKKHIKSKKN